MRSFRDLLGKMRREYRREASRVDDLLTRQFAQVDEQFQAIQQQFQVIEHEFQRARLQFASLRGELGAVVEAVVQLRAEHRDLGRTMQGRIRLMEERLSTMLDLVGGTVDFDISDLKARVERLEKKVDPAA